MTKTWNARKNKYHLFFKILVTILNTCQKEYKFQLLNYKNSFDKWNKQNYEKINKLTIKDLIKKFSNDEIKNIIDNINNNNNILNTIFKIKFNEFFNMDIDNKELYEKNKTKFKIIVKKGNRFKKKIKKLFKSLTNEKFPKLNIDNNNNNNKIFLIKKIYFFAINDSLDLKKNQNKCITENLEKLKKYINKNYIHYIDIINDRKKKVEIINNSTMDTLYNDNNLLIDRNQIDLEEKNDFDFFINEINSLNNNFALIEKTESWSYIYISDEYQ